MFKRKVTNTILIVIIFVTCLPFIQQTSRFFNEKPLAGAFTSPQKPELNFNSWMDGGFQERYTTYFNSNIGFRSTLVRLRNQLFYSIFNQSAEGEFVIGKNKNIFNINNVRSVTGDDFAGEELIQRRINKLQVIQDSLKNRGISFFIVIAPGKANYYSEYIPTSFKQADSTQTNYYWIKNGLSKSKINFIDFQQQFVAMKDTTKHLLYTKGGLHWSTYGMVYAMDSILRYMKQFGNNDIANFSIGKIKQSDSALSQDVDQEEALNLLFPLKRQHYSYPEWSITNEPANKPKILGIGDSFFMTFVYSKLGERLFDYEYWYYHRLVYPQSFAKEITVDEIDYWNDIFKQKYILVVTSEVSWGEFGFDFTDNLYYYFTDKPRADIILGLNSLLRKVKNMADYIKSPGEWYQSELIKAKQQSISVNEVIMNDTYWIIEDQMKLSLEEKSEIPKYENYLLNSAEFNKDLDDLIRDSVKYRKETVHLLSAYLVSKKYDLTQLQKQNKSNGIQ